MKKLCIQERIDQPADPVNMVERYDHKKMGRYTVGTQSSSFIMPLGTTVHPHAENLLSFAAEKAQEMLLRATVGPILPQYAMKRNLIQNNPMLSDYLKLQHMRNIMKFTNDNMNVFQEITRKLTFLHHCLQSVSTLKQNCQMYRCLNFRNPASKMHDFLATFIQSDLYEYEYFLYRSQS